MAEPRQATWEELPYLFEANLEEARSLLERLRRSVRAKVAALTRAYYGLLSPRQRLMLLRRPEEGRARLIERSARTGRLFGMWISRTATAYAREIARERRMMERLGRRLAERPEKLTLDATIEILEEMRGLAEESAETLRRLGRLEMAELAGKVAEEIGKLAEEKRRLKPPRKMWRITYAVNWVFWREYFSVVGQAWSLDRERLIAEARAALIEKVREYAEERIGYRLEDYPQFEDMPEKGITEKGVKRVLLSAAPPIRIPEEWREGKVVKLPAAWYDAEEGPVEVEYDEKLVDRYEIRFEDLNLRTKETVEEGSLDEL